MRACGLAFVVLSALVSACGPAIGDSCESALDCSSQGSRLCDRTQPSGYCTLQGCEQGTCPQESDCIRFRPAKDRLASTYCMLSCEESSDCRTGEGYACLSPSNFGDPDAMEADNLDAPGGRFCALPSSPAPMEEGTVGTETQADAGTEGS